MALCNYRIWRSPGSTLLAVAFWALSSGLSVVSTDQVTDQKPIKLGMSTALTGPAKDLGVNMMLGVDAAIREANEAGGINGRHIELVVLDDGYEPTRTAPNMHELIEKERVLAIVGNVGTPTAVAAVPIANSLKTPFIGAYTGGDVLRRSPPDRYIVNYRASYAQETAAMVDALIQHAGLAPEEIGFFTQRDAYGDAGYEGGLAALKRHGLGDDHVIAHGWYRRNTLAVENGLADILQSPVPSRAIIMVGAYAPCARFISLAKEYGVNAIFLNVSFVGTNSLAEALGEDGDGVIITQVVPPPTGDTVFLRGYREAILKVDEAANPNYGSLEGYIATQVLVRALRSSQGEIDREGVIDALEGLGSFELDEGLDLSLSPNDHQACDRVWPSVLRGGQAVPFDWSELPTQLSLVREGTPDDE